VQTGALQRDGRWEAPDLEVHLAAAELEPDGEERALMQPYCYEPACSPHLAGRMAGDYPQLERCVAAAEALEARHQGVLIEGAGGLLVPLNEEETQLSLIIELGVPVLVVAHIGLGTVNHTLLTLEALDHADVPIAGVIFNAPEPGVGDDFIARDNPDAVKTFGGATILGNIPCLERLADAPEEAWSRFEDHLPGLDAIESYFTARP
jgi:dethiobiotin synthase